MALQPTNNNIPGVDFLTPKNATTIPPAVAEQAKETAKQNNEDNIRTKVSAEDDFRIWRDLFSEELEATSILNPKKKATNSYMNKYAFISYGGNYLGNESMKNTFVGLDGKSNHVPGLSGDLDTYKEPTTSNIIKWSKTLKPNKNTENDKNATSNKASVPDIETDTQYQNTLNDGTNKDRKVTARGGVAAPRSVELGSTVGNSSDAVLFGNGSKQQFEKKISDNYSSGGLTMGLGNLEYDWKDFSFCKHFGQISNNFLITLRRFKLPVLDNGIIAGKERLKTKIAAGSYDPEEYLTSDSARALTYMGGDTGNDWNTFLNFTVGLNWAQHQEALGNPKINEGIRNPNNPLDNPVDGSQLIKMITPGNFNLDPTRNAFTRALSSWALQNKVEEEGLTDINEYVKKYSKDFDPFSNGWQNRVYGPINVVTRTMYRKRGLRFDNDTITLKFHYNAAQVETLNSKLAMLDVINNMYALTYNAGQFYGGDYRFQRQPTNFPLPTQLVDILERLSTGDSSVDYGDLFTSMKGYASSGLKQFVEDAQKEWDIIEGNENISKELSNLSSIKDFFKTEETQKAAEEIEKTQKNASNKSIAETAVNLGAVGISNIMGFSKTFIEKILTGSVDGNGNKIPSVIDSTINIIQELQNSNSKFTKIAINSVLFEEQYDIEKIADKMIKINPLITGEPVGEWHLTVGNPMNPTMMIGNLICTGMKMDWGDVMGPDDFPTEIGFTVTLQHARDRDMHDIMSMFNLGQGRFYVPTEGSKEPWDTGFSSRNTENDTGKLTNIEKNRLKENADGSYGDADYLNNGQIGEQGLEEEPIYGPPSPGKPEPTNKEIGTIFGRNINNGY